METPRKRHRHVGRTAGIVGLAGLVAVYAKYRPAVARLDGNSMEPSIPAGTCVLILRLPPRRGSVVVAEHPSKRMEIIKRVTAVPGDTVQFGPAELTLARDEWWLEGDAGEWSTDSRRFGPITRDAIRGRAIVLRRKTP